MQKRFFFPWSFFLLLLIITPVINADIYSNINFWFNGSVDGSNNLISSVNNIKANPHGTPTHNNAVGYEYITFNGNTDFFSINGTQTFEFNSTVGAWIKTPGPTSDEDIIGNGLSSSGDMLLMVTGSDDFTRAHYRDTSGVISDDDNEDVGDDAYHQVIQMVCGNQLQIYIDGDFKTQTALVGNSVSAAINLWIGARSDSPVETYDGEMTGIFGYNSCLNATEVGQLYNMTKDGNYSRYPNSGNFSITANDLWDNGIITTFNATVGGHFFSTVDGSLETNFTYLNAQVVNVTVRSQSYFERLYVNYNTSTNLNALLFQAEARFNATQFITGEYIVGNFTINATKKATDEPFYLRAGIHNVSFSSNGHYNKSQLVNVTALSNSTYTILNITNALLNTTAVVGISLTPIQSFNVTVTHSSGYSATFSTTSGMIPLFLINSTFNFTPSSANYGLANTTTLNLSVGNQSYQFVLFSLNTLFMQFLDEETLLVVPNVTFNVLSLNFSGAFNSGTSVFNISSLPSGDYQIRYGINSTIYAPRSYYLRIPFSSTTQANISFLVINQSISSLFVRQVVDENIQPLEDSLLEIQRPYVSTTNGSFIYRTVEIATIDSEGNAVFTAIPNTQQYRFRILRDFQLIDTKSPTFLTDAEEQIVVIEGGTLVDAYNSCYETLVGSSLTYQNSSSSFILDYFDATNTLDSVCLQYSWTQRFNSSMSSVCSASSTGTLTLPRENNLNGTYVVTGYANFSDNECVLASKTFTFGETTDSLIVFGILGPILFILCMVMAYSLSKKSENIIASILIGVASLGLLSLQVMGFIGISLTGYVGILIVSGIIIVMVED